MCAISSRARRSGICLIIKKLRRVIPRGMASTFTGNDLFFLSRQQPFGLGMQLSQPRPVPRRSSGTLFFHLDLNRPEKRLPRGKMGRTRRSQYHVLISSRLEHYYGVPWTSLDEPY